MLTGVEKACPAGEKSYAGETKVLAPRLAGCAFSAIWTVVAAPSAPAGIVMETSPVELVSVAPAAVTGAEMRTRSAFTAGDGADSFCAVSTAVTLYQ